MNINICSYQRISEKLKNLLEHESSFLIKILKTVIDAQQIYIYI